MGGDLRAFPRTRKGDRGGRGGTGGLTPAGVSPSIHPPPDLSTGFFKKHPRPIIFWVRGVDRVGNRAYTTLLEKEKTPHVRGIPLGLFARNHGTNRRQPQLHRIHRYLGAIQDRRTLSHPNRPDGILRISHDTLQTQHVF